MSKENTQYQLQITTALNQTLQRAQQQEPAAGKLEFDIHTAKYIICSDVHKGNRNNADDFRKCERAYNAALAYYFRLGYTLVLLGDVEELWEERAAAVMQAYSHTLALEGQFHQAGRYLRVWGNHDDVWQYPDQVKKHLLPALGGGELQVPDCLILHAMDGDQEVGRMLMLHGHQGTAWCDRHGALAKWLVRVFWRPVQRLIPFSWNTPAKDFHLRSKHDTALCRWAEAQQNLVLIAGHTHRPVFKSATHEALARETLASSQKQLDAKPHDPALQRQTAQRAAELEWILAQNLQNTQAQQSVEPQKPAYFNTGCCAFLDGDITALEICEGEIRLVRWPDNDDCPRPQQLANARLETVFAECA